MTNSRPSSDPHNLQRFVDAQEHIYPQALGELQSGLKRTHWMWFTFPQLAGLGSSERAQFYAIRSLEEARAYLAHPVLGSRLLECAQAVLAVEGRTANDIFGSPDDMKLSSCATLFASVSPPGSLFDRILEKYYASRRDDRTLGLLAQRSEENPLG